MLSSEKLIVTESASILLITKDLFFLPVLRSAAETFGFKVHNSSKVDWEPAEDQPAPIGCVLDLGAISLADLPSIAKHLDGMLQKPQRLAFGSHVHAVRLERAAEAGFSPVLTKSQIQGQLPRVLQQWSEADA